MNEKRKMIVAVLLTAVVCIAGTYSLTSNSGSSEDSDLTVTGSTTIQPMMSLFQEEFEKYASVTMNVTGGGSGAGATAAINGTADIGMLSRDLKSSEISSGLVAHVIAMDGVVIIVNSDVGVTDLTLEQLAKIYDGEITNWKDVGGMDLTIAVVAREDGSGTRECFETTMKTVDSSFVMKNDVATYNSTGGVTSAVNSTPGSIGYVNLNAVEHLSNNTKAISVDGIAATSATVTDGSYEISRNLILVTKGEATGMAAFFLNWVISEDGQKIVEDAGFVRIA
ncbi:MAG: phosphate ABC transporter substrate-binding protein [Candidatus Methanomethylophilaceae archaeon]